MQLREALQRILDEYPMARSQPLTGHPLANYIRSDVPDGIKEIIPTITFGRRDLLVNATVFPGNWAYVPWLAVLDPRITNTTQKGVYVVYLFSEDGSIVLLTVAQGVTHSSRSQLAEDRRKLLSAVPKPSGFEAGPPPPGALGQSSRARSYENSIVCFRSYQRAEIPDEHLLRRDLTLAIEYIDSVIASPVIKELSYSGIDAPPNVDSVQWRGHTITTEDVNDAFESTTAEDWNTRPGIEPHWVVWNEGESKPLKAVFRRIEGIADEQFTTQEAAAVFRRLGFTTSDTKADDTTSYKGRRRLWVIAPGRDAELWDQSLTEGFISIGWDELGDLTQYKNIDEITAALKKGREEGEANPTNNARCNWEFSRVMQPGDLVYAKKGMSVLLGIGVVTGPCTWNADVEHPKHRRAVKWLKIGGWELPGDSKFAIKTLTDITDSPFADELNRLAEFSEQDAVLQVRDVVAERSAPEFTIGTLAEETGYEPEQLREWVARLNRKKQIVLQGPPGTGKTFLARGMARVLISNSLGIVELVQFHPSYAYEDFMQGIRPDLIGTALSFRVRDGRFIEFCDKARRVAPSPAVLIIDELNRANLAKVFGELMYLLEYRRETVPLAVDGRKFSIPDNVLIIGTMNTADRSIALVDHALRRRFSFIHLTPNYEILRKHLTRHDLPADSLVSTLMALNKTIGDRHYEVGISFFLQDGKALRKTLRDVWVGEIEPYIEEYFYDQEEKVEAFRFSHLVGEALSDWA
jgi:hypothetical protein